MMAKIFETWGVDAKKDEEFIRSFLRMVDLEDTIQEVRLIPVFDYGSEGSEPYEGACPERENDEDMSCVSGSGSSMCGCYRGHADAYVVACGSTKVRKAKDGKIVWMKNDN
jgi:hypothetical protein